METKESTTFCKVCRKLKVDACHNCDLHFQELVLSAIEQFADETGDPEALKAIEEAK